MKLAFKNSGSNNRRLVFLMLAICIFAARTAAAQEIVPPSASGQADVRLEADQQRKEGDIYFADGNVEIQYKNLRFRADHVQYNTKTFLATARDHVQLDVDTQHLSADSGDFNIASGEGHFQHRARRNHNGAQRQPKHAGVSESTSF